jgi:hypothetical protein
MAIFMERFGSVWGADGRQVRRTMHSDPFFAKPVFRRAGQRDLPLCGARHT